MKIPQNEGMHFGAPPIVFDHARILRIRMTAEEKILWNYLKTKPYGYKFRRQHPCGNYILDFYCHKMKLSIELDGGYHLKKEQIARDRKRTSFLTECGIKELRFNNEIVIENIDEIIEEIKLELRTSSPLGDGGKNLELK